MKRTFLLVFALVVAAEMSAADENFVNSLASIYSMEKDDVWMCLNKTHATVEDERHFDQTMRNGIEMVDFDDRSLKIGCLYACIGQKLEVMTGSRLNVEKIKESKHPFEETHTKEQLAAETRILDTCADQVKDETNECHVPLKFKTCMWNNYQNATPSTELSPTSETI